MDAGKWKNCKKVQIINFNRCFVQPICMNPFSIVFAPSFPVRIVSHTWRTKKKKQKQWQTNIECDK